MTQQRRDNNSTEYGIWLRQQPELDSELGFVTTNIDYLWMNYKTSEYMFKEEKRHGKMPKKYQVSIYQLLDKLASEDSENYRGFHCVVFENTSPEDGHIFLDGKFITITDLKEFLIFEKPEDWYQSWFPAQNVVGVSFSHLIAK